MRSCRSVEWSSHHLSSSRRGGADFLSPPAGFPLGGCLGRPSAARTVVAFCLFALAPGLGPSRAGGSSRAPRRLTLACASASRAYLSYRANSSETVSMLWASSLPTNRLLVTPSLNAMMMMIGEMRRMVLRTWLKRWMHCRSVLPLRCQTARRSPRISGRVNDPEKLVTNFSHSSPQDPTDHGGRFINHEQAVPLRATWK